MKNHFKRILCALVVICLCATMLPTMTFETEAASSGLTLGQLQAKFPHGKYWNHAGNPGSSNSVNNQNGYTSTPCSQHGVVGTSKQTCNGFQPGSSQLSWQCMGYAEKLGYDATGYNPRNNANGWHTYTSSSALDNLKAGDIVRYKNGGHSIYVTAVSGNTVTYTDCNSDGHCIIRWNQTISKSTLRSTFTHVRSAPSSVTPGPSSCNCTTSYSGTYTCTTASLSLNIRSGHGSSYGVVGSIPSGASVSVSMADGTWAHVTYNGVSGYASMSYLTKQNAHTHNFYYAYESAHPHKQYKHCTGCGHFEHTGATRNEASCTTCNPPQRAETPSIHYWLSTSAYGDAISDFKIGNRYYYNYRLYDSVSGKGWDSVEDCNYTITIAIYNPDGSLNYSHKSSSDESWLSIYYQTPGTYTRTILIEGDYYYSGRDTFTVADNPLKVHTSSTSVNLTLGSNETYKINVWSSGYYGKSYHYNWARSNTNVSCSWGDWTGSAYPLTITANSPGTTTLTLSVRDGETNNVINSIQVTVTVTANTFTVSYNANGGTGAPSSQTKTHGTSLTLSNTVPKRNGYTFLGWAKSSNATSPTYKPGATYTTNASLTLYAVWKKATAISVGSQFTVPITYGGQEYIYSFTPSSSGKYIIYSSVAEDTKVYLYKSNGEQLGYDDDGGESRNFRLECNLIGGTTYYFGIKYYSSSGIGNITAKIDSESLKVTYNANGGAGAPASQTKISGTNLTLSNTIPTRKGYNFLGWAKSSGATSPTYKPGDSYSTNSAVTLYAVWKKATALSINSEFSTAITYGGQEYIYSFTPSSSGRYVIYSSGTDDTKVYLYNSNGERLAYNDDGGESRNFRLEYNLTSGTTYYIGICYYSTTRTGTVTADFERVYTVTYNANGGSGAPSSQTKYYNTPITLSSAKPTRNKYVFRGWATSPNSTSVSYNASSSLNLNRDVTLYAVWEKSDVSQISILSLLMGETYFIGDKLETVGGVNLEVSYEDGYTENIEDGYTISGFDSSKPGQNTVYVTYGGQQTKFVVNIQCAPGDVDADGSVTAVDLAKMSRHLLSADYTVDQTGADANSDGKLSITDLIRMKKLLANS